MRVRRKRQMGQNWESHSERSEVELAKSRFSGESRIYQIPALLKQDLKTFAGMTKTDFWDSPLLTDLTLQK